MTRERSTHPKLGVLAALLLCVALPSLALADSIDPASVVATIDPGETLTITKTVTVTAQPPSEAAVDVFFLFDSTGSMGPFIDSAKAGAGAILAGVSGLGDLAYGVGTYEDFPQVPFGAPTDVPFDLIQDFSSDAAATAAAIGSIDLGLGLDVPESQLHALDQVATTTSWRDGSTRVAVWFGDAPGHDGDMEPGYPSDVGLGDTIKSLTGENIVVQAFDFDQLDATGQATAITDATGGDLFTGVDPGDIDQVVDTIVQAIEDVIMTYSVVELEVVGDTDNTDVTITPLSITGDFDRSEDRVFEFEMEVTGLTPGVDDFEVRALVDGGVVAVEKDRITVTPEPGSVALFGLGALLVTGSLRRRAQR